MKVLKFGGTSVGSIENLQKVKAIVEKQSESVVVVVSALGGITDKILDLANTAANTRTFSSTEMMEITTRHMTTIETLVPSETQTEVKAKVQERLDELRGLLKGVSLLGELTPKTLDRIGGCGEMLSSAIIAPFLNAQWHNSAELIKTDSNYGKANVDFFKTNANIKGVLSKLKGVAVVPGFVASNDEGITTTLGRGGSDYTAAIYASALDASSLEIWTDVTGFMTADPRVIRKAYTIDYLTYSEAMELSHFGAKVIYPPTILPVFKKKIPVWIKNTTQPNEEGTLIGHEKKAPKERVIKGISSISNISLLTLQGAGMVGVSGIAMRVFSALAKQDVNVILISQASSENSISVAVPSEKAQIAIHQIEAEFNSEIKTGLVNGVLLESDLSIVAIVGENMKESAGIAGKLFNILGKNGINVRAIAQGGSELNISWVVKTSDLRKTLNVIHEGFFLSSFKELNLYMIGIGTVGSHFIEQLKLQQPKLMKDNRLKIKLVGVANSKKMLFERDGIDLNAYKELLNESAITSSFSDFVNTMAEMNMYNSVFVDCTANEQLAEYYLEILNQNVSIVAANKVAASSEFSKYRQLKETARCKGIKFYFETNVGAGLPVLSTIKDLVSSGDSVLRIQAVLSGTLNYIFNTLSENIPFSKAIQMAMDAGYAEPDPRIDLSGKDVVRKLLILAREAGYELEEEQVSIVRFIPDELFEGSLDDFWNGVKQLDAKFENRRKQLQAENKKLRFIANFEVSNSNASLQEVEANSPFYDLEGSNNIILFTTERYNEYPLQIKGYGAGAEVTAAGVFGDVIRIANIY